MVYTPNKEIYAIENWRVWFIGILGTIKMKLDQLNIAIGQQDQLTDYFRFVYENAETDWNVESALPLFGHGRSNEGTEESKATKRYYVEPTDKRFREIYLNFDDSRNIESVVWFMDRDKSELITLGELKTLFGNFKIQNIIYDETTEVVFTPNFNENVGYVRTSVLDLVERRPDNSLYYEKDDKEIEVDDNYKVSSLILKIKKSA